MWKSVFVFCLVTVFFTNITDMIANAENKQYYNILDKYKENPNLNPCEPYNPPVPNFSAPGRRISQSKCYEYIWDIKYRIDEEYRRELCRNRSSILYIIGGKPTEPGEFPHMGAIGWKASVGTWVFKCGSTLISPKFVLTAAHCTRTTTTDTSVEDVVPRIVRFRKRNVYDDTDIFDPPLDKNISKIIVHPLYRPPNKYYDIALIELETEVNFDSSVQPACLWTNPDDSSLLPQAIVTGWGVTSEASRRISPNLMRAVIDIIDRKTCDNIYRPLCNRLFCGVKDHQLCAGLRRGGVDSCQGDSGGPLQIKIKLPTKEQGEMCYIIGVTSFGKGCGRAESPGIYTKVASFLDWIENIVWGHI